MINEQGKVVSVSDHDIVVEVLKTSACQSCKAKQGCGQAVLSHWGDAEKQQQKNHFKIPFPNKTSVKIGDTVELAMAHDTVTKVALIVYMVPLVFAFVGLFVSMKIGLSEGLQLLSMVGAFTLSFWFLGQLNVSKSSALIPQIIHLYPASKGGDLIASTRAESL